MQSAPDFTVIHGNGYTKNLFSHLNLSPNSQVSSFEWKKDGESPWHDHSVDEITLVHKGRIEQICLTREGKSIVTTHEAGTYFTVPAGTIHQVRALEESTTVNICDGDLQMKTFHDALEATSAL